MVWLVCFFIYNLFTFGLDDNSTWNYDNSMWQSAFHVGDPMNRLHASAIDLGDSVQVFGGTRGNSIYFCIFFIGLNIFHSVQPITVQVSIPGEADPNQILDSDFNTYVNTTSTFVNINATIPFFLQQVIVFALTGYEGSLDGICILVMVVKKK